MYVLTTVGLNMQETLKKNGRKIFLIPLSISELPACEFFYPTMAIGGAAISFFPNLNFGLKILLGNNISKKLVLRTFGTMFCPKDWSKWPKSED